MHEQWKKYFLNTYESSACIRLSICLWYWNKNVFPESNDKKQNSNAFIQTKFENLSNQIPVGISFGVSVTLSQGVGSGDWVFSADKK